MSSELRVGLVKLDDILFHPHNVRRDLGDLQGYDTSKYPDLFPVALRALKAETTGTASFNPRYLASFAEHDHVTVKCHGAGTPALIIGNDFLGVIMPLRPEVAQLDEVTSDWSEVLGGTESKAA